MLLQFAFAKFELMMKFLVSFVLALLAIGLGAETSTANSATNAWQIGPIIDGRSYSKNMPLYLYEGRDGPWFDFPGPSKSDGHVHYVTIASGPLNRAKRITMRYRIDSPPDVKFRPQEAPGEEATMSLYFQRHGDRWTRDYPHYRWYSPTARVVKLRPGVHEISIGLDEPWVAMMGGNSHTLPGPFAKTLTDTARIGFTFGGSTGRGHGVYATRPARFTLLEFEVR